MNTEPAKNISNQQFSKRTDYYLLTTELNHCNYINTDRNNPAHRLLTRESDAPFKLLLQVSGCMSDFQIQQWFIQ